VFAKVIYLTARIPSPTYSLPFNAQAWRTPRFGERCMNYFDRFNQGGFSLWWSLRCLQAIFCAWAVASLLGLFLHSKRLSELGYMLSDTLLYIVLLTAVVQSVLSVFRRIRSR
jgi:hypothetical protein